MKKIIISLMFAFNSYAGSVDGNSVVHLLGSGVLNSAIYFGMSAFTGRGQENKRACLIASSVFSFAFGLAIEVQDANGGRLDGADLTFDALGVVLSSLLIYHFDILPNDTSLQFNGKTLQLGWKF